MKCPKCNGRKYIEVDKIGLVVTDCPECNGIGEVEEQPDNSLLEETLVEVAAEANAFANGLLPKLYGEIDDSNRGTGLADTAAGSTDTGKPKQRKKPKAKRKARARTG